MLSFITYKDAPEEIEIIFDNQGANELIQYLEELKKEKDHMHLTIGTELDEYPIIDKMKDKVFYVKQIRLEYADKEAWNNLSEK